MNAGRPVVVAAAPVYSEALEVLEAHADARVLEPAHVRDANALAAALADADALYCTSDLRVDAALLAHAPRLRVVATSSVGYEHIDLAACAARGIAVGNTPGVLVEATADIAFGLVLSVMRRIPESAAWVRAGHWPGNKFPFGVDLGGKTMGIVGMGSIGTAVARRARASTMRIIYNNRTPRHDADALGAAHVSFPELLAGADVVVITAPLTEETRGLFGREAFERMKPTAFIVNVARGPVVRTDALVDALRERRIAGAALDVTDPEPLPADHPLPAFDNVVITPHVGSATRETRSAMSLLTAQNIVAALAGTPMPAPVALPAGALEH